MDGNMDTAAAQYADIAEALRARDYLVSDWMVAEAPRSDVAPLWVRPTNGYGNACCQVVDDLEDFPLAAMRIRKTYPETALLLQPVLRGPTYRVIGFKYGARFLPAAIMRERMMRAAVRVPMVLQFPCDLADRYQAALLDLARVAGNALPTSDSPAEVEIVWTTDGPVVTDARLTSEVDPWNVRLVRLALGIDLDQAHGQLRQGQEPTVSSRSAMVVVIRWLTARTGLVRKVAGVEAAQAVPGVETIHLEAAPGHTLRHVVDTATRTQTGYILVTGPDLTQALRHMEFALAPITITTSKMTGPPVA